MMCVLRENLHTFMVISSSQNKKCFRLKLQRKFS